jgi:ribA/ribD-fused uncharacterized protein
LNLELCNDPPSRGPIRFYELRHYWASNFSSFAVHYQGHLYPTSEHAYQASKFPVSGILWSVVALATSAHQAMVLARNNKDSQWPDWEHRKRAVMKDIVRAKLEQHPYIQQKLLETGKRQLIEVSPVDSFWGWGPKKKGRNELGKIWMELREELRAHATANEMLWRPIPPLPPEQSVPIAQRSPKAP